MTVTRMGACRANMRAFIFCATAVLLTACAETRRTNADIKTELEAMFDTDQSQRKDMEAFRKKYGSSSPEMASLWKKQRSIDERNIARLIMLVDRNGWPGIHGV